jgi:hypothetical protein
VKRVKLFAGPRLRQKVVNFSRDAAAGHPALARQSALDANFGRKFQNAVDSTNRVLLIAPRQIGEIGRLTVSIAAGDSRWTLSEPAIGQ